MFIEYSSDAVKNSGHSVLRKSLDYSCTAMRDGTHVVCTENRDVAERICSIMSAEQHIYRFFDRIHEYFAQIACVKNEVDVFVRIISGTSSPKVKKMRDKKKVISIGIQQTLNEYFWRETTFVTENTVDYDAYKIIVAQSNPLGIRVKSYSQNGGGTTTAAVIKNLITENRFILCMVDSDRHYPGDKLGETAKKVVKIAKDTPLCCVDIISSLEIENLFLTEGIICCLYGGHSFPEYKKIIDSLRSARLFHGDIGFFYDVKKGYVYKKIRGNHYLLTSFQNDIQDCGRNMSKCDCKECDNFVIKGLGSDFLFEVVNKDDIVTEIQKNYSFFPEHIKAEWQRIARIVLSWCCANRLEVLGV